ncbi:alpha-L-fucosidase [Blautia sp.]|uniref:alpha-L-fucosidase n=1 Tax=Blautia sp. TaxID=1955243 RepID=UPI0025C0502F|nr:alpha-L-fucosidase [Blautia sp.]
MKNCFGCGKIVLTKNETFYVTKKSAIRNKEKAMADTKQQWYKDAKYGLFIHWGLYSILAGEWKDPKTGEVTKTDRIAEWIENTLNIDKEDYRKLKDEFHPDKFDADMFVKRAKEQWGVKYIVLTSKHHEGFAMYDSKVSDFNVVKATGRDILRELSDACKKYDMTMGIYYSQAQDWDDDNAYKKDYEDKNEWKPEFRTYFDEKCKPQLKELLENYDNISLIWFDTPMGMTADEAQELRDWVKGIKPDCIISGRIGHQKGDYMTTGDNFIPRLPYDGDWEVPATVNDTWGYNKYDTNWKNPDDILNLLLKIVGRGGNYLLNVGPMADGTVPEACVEVMNEVGKYVTENAEAIYGTKNVGIYPYEIPSIEFTKRPHKLYVHVLAPRYRVELLNIGNQLKGAYVVSTGEKLPCRALKCCEGNSMVEVELPEKLQGAKNYCVCLELEEEEPIFEAIID